MPLEMHIVHLYPDGGLGAVLGVFFDPAASDDDNMFLNSFNPLFNSGEESAAGPLKLRSYLESINSNDFWSYNGSLTTPPCTEGIKWSVLQQVQNISPAQLKQFTDLWAGDKAFADGKGNNREIMPLNKRTLYTSNDKPFDVLPPAKPGMSPLLKFYPIVGALDIGAGIWNMNANKDQSDDWSLAYYAEIGNGAV